MGGANAKRSVRASSYPVTARDVAVLEFPGDLNGGPDVSSNLQESGSRLCLGAEPHMVITRPVDLGLERLPNAPHRESLTSGLTEVYGTQSAQMVLLNLESTGWKLALYQPDQGFHVVRPLGLEPRTCGLRVRCSAN